MISTQRRGREGETHAHTNNTITGTVTSSYAYL